MARSQQRRGVVTTGAGGGGGTQVGNTYPQTTRGQGRTFPELSRIAQRTGYLVGLGSQGWGQAVDQPLAASPGYYRYLDLLYYLTGGNATTNSVALATTPAGVDAGVHNSAMFNNVLVRDAAGNTIYALTDPLALYLINEFSGQSGVMQAANPASWPSYVAIPTGTATTAHSFMGHLRIPFEIAQGTAYGTIAGGAANLQPTLHLGIQPLASVYGTAPSTTPSITVEVDENYWAAVPGMEPPDLGTSLQWQQITANPSVASGAATKITLGKTEGYITTLVLVFRDSTGARSDSMLPGGNSTGPVVPFGTPSSSGKRLQLWVDSVLVADEDINERMDNMYTQFPGLTVTGARIGPVGVIVYTFRNSVSQAVLGPDTGELWTPSTPGTLIEVGSTGWGTFANTPGSITALIGSIVPGPGGIQQGLGNVVP